MDTDRKESGQSAVWLEVEMAKLCESDRRKVVLCSLTHGPGPHEGEPCSE